MWFAQCKERPMELAVAIFRLTGMLRLILAEKQREYKNFNAAIKALMDALIWK